MKDFIIHYDNTVAPDELALIQRQMMEASLMYPGCNFQLQRDDYGAGADPYGVDSLYPEVALRNGVRSDLDTSHVVLSHDDRVVTDDFHYHAGRTFVTKQNLDMLDGLSPTEQSEMLGLTLNDQLDLMYGRAVEREVRYDVEQLAREMEEEERRQMLMDGVDDDEEYADYAELMADEDKNMILLSELLRQRELEEAEAKQIQDEEQQAQSVQRPEPQEKKMRRRIKMKAGRSIGASELLARMKEVR